MNTSALRVLVVSDLCGVRRIFETGLPPERFDVFFERDEPAAMDFALWAEPHVIFLALEHIGRSMALYRSLRSEKQLAESFIGVVSLPCMQADLLLPCSQTGDQVLFARPVLQEIVRFAMQGATRALRRRPTHPVQL